MKSFVQRYMRNYGAVAGLAIMLIVVVVALAAPLLYEESPWMMVADPLIPPFTNPDYPFGTDMLGRDITAGLVWGARVSLMVGLLSTAVALLFGILVGAVAGYWGGRMDDALMRFTEFFQTIPQLAMALGIQTSQSIRVKLMAEMKAQLEPADGPKLEPRAALDRYAPILEACVVRAEVLSGAAPQIGEKQP